MAKLEGGDERKAEVQRLDKWLWYARVAKTRTLAATLVQQGKVRVNRARTDKPGTSIKVDDVITIAVHGRVRVLKVVEPGRRRGPAVEAQQLFEDLSPATTGMSARGVTVSGGKRPSKKARRAIDKLRESDGSD